MYVSKVEEEISSIKHPINSSYSYAVTKEARGLVHHLIFPREEGMVISIRDKVVANISDYFPNWVPIVRDGVTHVYILDVLKPDYSVIKH